MSLAIDIIPKIASIAAAYGYVCDTDIRGWLRVLGGFGIDNAFYDRIRPVLRLNAVQSEGLRMARTDVKL